MNGRTILARALLDSGSELNFITSSLAQSLGIPLTKTNISLRALGGISVGSSSYTGHIMLQGKKEDETCSIQVFIVRATGIVTPSVDLKRNDWKHLSDLDLADPEFFKSKPVDVVLGVNVFAKIILKDLRKGPLHCPIAQKTQLGWIVLGSVPTKNNTRCFLTPDFHGQICTTQQCNLSELIHRFGELEEITTVSKSSAGERECENLFKEGCRQTSSGQFIVRLPVKSSLVEFLGDTLKSAIKTLESTEKRMKNDQRLSEEYNKFMHEYEALGHMREIDPASITKNPINYIPHHGIWQKSDGREKLRVVFNASRKSTSGYSLNDVLHVGEKLQNNIFSIIL